MSDSAQDAYPERGLEKDPPGLRQGLAEESMRFSQRLCSRLCPSLDARSLGSFETGLKFDLLSELTRTMAYLLVTA